MRRLVSVVGLLGFLCLACGDGDAAAGGAAAEKADADGVREAAAEAAPRRNERPLPAFGGVTLEGDEVSVSDLVGRRLVVLFFDPDQPEAAAAAAAAAAISGERGAHNFRILGVATRAARPDIRRFAEEHELDFPVIDDADGSLTQRLGLRGPALLLGVDAEGYITYARNRFPIGGVSDPAGAIEADLREALRLPEEGRAVEPVLGEQPKAPDFEAPRLGSDEPFALSDLRGRPVVLIFFLHTCPHCHKALETLRGLLPEVPEASRPRLVGVSLQNRPSTVRKSLEAEGLDFFPVLFDPDGSVSEAYGGVTGVPVLFGIDSEGRIAFRVQGWREDRDPPLMRMRVASLAGQPVPMLLHPEGYSGNEFCVTCHEPQHETWLLTDHARAFATLVKHGAERDPECVGCHVVGYGEPGGYTLESRPAHLEDVGCEACHGRGGPHLSPQLVEGGDYEAVCVECHDPKHSLGFEYASFVPKVSHAANAKLASLSLEEKRAIVRRRKGPREDLLPTRAAYVGSRACAECHPAEYETWSESGHARALASLEAEDEASNPDCLRCHTTGYERDGGFPAGGDPDAHPHFANVGCEACHGPGGDHASEDARKVGTVVSLGDKCDSCVILQICGGCHDDANDPGFEFEVQEKIEAQRHGTIEPSGGAPPAEARLPGDPAAQVGLLEHALAVHGAGE